MGEQWTSASDGYLQNITCPPSLCAHPFPCLKLDICTGARYVLKDVYGVLYEKTGFICIWKERKFYPRVNKVSHEKKYICYQALGPEYSVYCVHLAFSKYTVNDTLLRESEHM